MTTSSSDSTQAAVTVTSTTLVDEEIDLEVESPDTDTTEIDPFQKVLVVLESIEETMVKQGKDLKDIKKRLRTMETNLEFIRQSQVSEARRLTNLEGDCARCPGKYTPLPEEALAAQDNGGK